MRPFRLCWSFLGRMVARMISCGVVLIEITGYAGGGAGEIVGALGRGALIGGFFGVLPSILCGVGLAVLILTFRRLPESIGKYRMIAVTTCAGVLLVPAGLLALVANDYEGVGQMILMPTYFELFGIPLIISVPFAALGAQRVAKKFSRRANARS